MEINQTILTNVRDYYVKTQTQRDCHDFLVQVLWQGKPKCPECGCEKYYFLEKRLIYKCAKPKCHYQYSVIKGTFFENTKLSLPDWFLLIDSFCSELNARKTSLKLKINYRTVLYAFHKIRNSLKFNNDGLLHGEVEIDEILYGSKPGDDLVQGYRISSFYKNEKKKKELDPNYEIKTFGHQKVIVNLVERNGRTITIKIGNSKGAITTDILEKIIERHVAKDAIIFMDAHPSHTPLRNKFPDRDFRFITHTKRILIYDDEGLHKLNNKGNKMHKIRKEFKDKEGNHTNGVENSNTLMTTHLKRFRKHSNKYSELYYNEFAFHRRFRKIEFLEKIREILWNANANTISIVDLLKLEDPVPEHKWIKEPKKSFKKHSRKKKVKTVNFKFS